MDVTLVVEKGAARTHAIHLRSTETVVGRQKGLGLRIPSALVSRRHCVLRFQDGHLTVEDLRSANGTILNGKRITRKEVVRPGDRLIIGPLVLVAQYQPGPATVARSLPRGVQRQPPEEFVEVLAVEDEEEFVEVQAISAEEDFVEAVPVPDEDEVIEALPVAEEEPAFVPVNLTPLKPEEVAALAEEGAVVEGIIVEEEGQHPEANPSRTTVSHDGQ